MQEMVDDIFEDYEPPYTPHTTWWDTVKIFLAALVVYWHEDIDE
jgi:hypothetical protein